MPIHDWTRVSAGIFHDFHCAWIVEIGNTLNNGYLPPEYYALAEWSDNPPNIRESRESEAEIYAKKANHIAIRHSSDDRIVTMVEILSPGNKSSQHAIDEFLDKVWALIDQGIHLLLVDLFPPTSRDPRGIHALIWGDSAPPPPADQALTLAAYHAVLPRGAYAEPTAVGSDLIDMPLFLDGEYYILVPLEATYQAAWRGVPQRWKAVLEA